LQSWFISEHLVDTPLVHSSQETSQAAD